MSPTEMPDDSEIVQDLLRGDRHAFEQIFRRYYRPLYQFVRRQILQKEDCEEILQDVFTSLWSNREKTLITSLKFYLFTAAKHRVVDHFRKARTRRHFEEEYHLFEIAYSTLPAPNRNPEAIRKVLEDIISSLPKRCQVAMKLRISENLSHKEIAERMNITPKTVETYMFAAFDHIRRSSFRERLDYY
jgi:RNA polymerase sigma-70 factor (family 1)